MAAKYFTHYFTHGFFARKKISCMMVTMLRVIPEVGELSDRGSDYGSWL